MAEQTSRGRILIIDDQEPTRYIFRRILTHAGFDVEEAATGSEGLAKAMLSPDLIISDVNLPDMLGYDVARRLKSNPATQSIPVLQISASFISDESRVQALEGGADAFLTQPLEPPVLVASVKALLRLRKAETLSHLSALQWQVTFDSLSDGLILADEYGTVVRINGRFIQMFGARASESEGTPLERVFATTFEREFEEFRRVLFDGKTVEISQDNRWFRVRYDVIRADHDRANGAILIVADITDQKKLQETLALSERLAATGRIAHIIAHEINNPLEALSNLLYLVEGRTLADEETNSYIRLASSELTRISQITKQVLSYHRESKRPTSASVKEMLEGVVAMFRLPVSGKTVEFRMELGFDAQILVHPGEMRQVFSNLISNAMDALSGQGQLRIRSIPSIDSQSNTTGIRILFSDNGAGIPEKTLPHIFEAFYSTKESKGSGVGLWLTAEILAKHHARVRVRTRTAGKYRGTLFDIFLPLSGNLSNDVPSSISVQ